MIPPIATVERRYRTHRGFLRACTRYRSRILAYIRDSSGWALVLSAEVQS